MIRRLRDTPERRAIRQGRTAFVGTMAGRAESSAPIPNRTGGANVRGMPARSMCPCPIRTRLCSPSILLAEQTLSWAQDSGFTEGQVFGTGTDLRLMHRPENNGSNQPWEWEEGVHTFGKGDLAHFFALAHVITDGELAALTDTAALLALNPLGHWPLDETSGTNANDDSGNNHDGTYSGGVTLGVGGSPWGGLASRYDGTDDYLNIPLPLAGSAQKTLTFGAWVNWDTFANDNRTLLDRGSQTDTVAIKITPNADYGGAAGEFAVEMWGSDTGSGGYAKAHCPRPASGWGLWIVSFDVDNLGQNSNSLGPRPKIRIWFGDANELEACALLRGDDVLYIDAPTTVALPPAATARNHIYYVKNISSGTVTLQPDGSDTIELADSYELESLESAQLVVDVTGTGWFVV